MFWLEAGNVPPARNMAKIIRLLIQGRIHRWPPCVRNSILKLALVLCTNCEMQVVPPPCQIVRISNASARPQVGFGLRVTRAEVVARLHSSRSTNAHAPRSHRSGNSSRSRQADEADRCCAAFTTTARPRRMGSPGMTCGGLAITRWGPRLRTHKNHEIPVPNLVGHMA